MTTIYCGYKKSAAKKREKSLKLQEKTVKKAEKCLT